MTLAEQHRRRDLKKEWRALNSRIESLQDSLRITSHAADASSYGCRHRGRPDEKRSHAVRELLQVRARMETIRKELA